MKRCTADGCNRPQNAKGLCPKHYYRNKTYGDPNKVRYPWREDRSCSVPECTEEHEAKGFCRKHYMVIHKFKINPDIYIEKIKNQNGLCAICDQQCSHGKMLSLDHDHETGSFRGLLCASCNLALGGFKDDPKIILSAFNYLKKWGKINV
jgi:hypothetical protein